MVIVLDQHFARLPFFDGVASDDLRELRRNADLTQLNGGDELLAIGETSQKVHFLVSGELRTIVHAANGRSVHLRYPPDTIFGALSLFDRKPSSASIEATMNTTLVSIRGPAFIRFLGDHPALYGRVIDGIGAQMRNLVEQVVEFSTLGVRERIHTELLRMCRQNGASDGPAIISPAPTHAELAIRVGTNRETVSRELSRLQQIGVVVRSSDGFKVPSVAYLERMADDAA